MLQSQFNYSDYIVYVDESGDHGLVSIDPQHPVFVLAFCIFHKESYCREVVPLFQQLKFQFFGHDSIVLHSHGIRKQKGDFVVLCDHGLRIKFLEAISRTIDTIPFTLIATVIDKQKLYLKYQDPVNPYDIAMQFCMERTYFFLKSKDQHQKLTHIVIEKRGNKEDQDLELACRRIVQGQNGHNKNLQLEAIFADKKHNSIGLQIADLVAYPIGSEQIRPKNNPAYDVIKKKFYCRENGDFKGYGLKLFP